MAKDWSNYTDPDRAMTIGWGNSDQGVKAPEATRPSVSQVILRHMVNNGMSLLNIAEDRGIPHDHLNDCYHGDSKALTLEDEARFAPLVRPFAEKQQEEIRRDNAVGRQSRGKMYHDLADAGYDVEKLWGVKL